MLILSYFRNLFEETEDQFFHTLANWSLETPYIVIQSMNFMFQHQYRDSLDKKSSYSRILRSSSFYAVEFYDVSVGELL